jgi:hypothetical protein
MTNGILDTMARDMVGDGKSPNLDFVQDENGTVIAVCRSERLADKIAHVAGAEFIEDRRHGMIWDRQDPP